MFESRDERAPETLSKRGFAEHIGVTPGRVSQLIAAGLPVEPSNRIRVERALAWIDANVDPNRRRSGTGGTCQNVPPVQLSPKGARDVAETEIAQLKAQRLSGRYVDRRATLRVIETRAKLERDALIAWVNRVAPLIASETAGDLGAIAAILDREIRAHLISLAEMPIEVPK